MEKLLSTCFAIVLLSSIPGVLFAEENIQLSDDYFEINASEDNTSSMQLKNQVPKNENEGFLSIEPSPNWNLQRNHENDLIEETSFQESSFDGIITQKVVELAKNNPDLMRAGKHGHLNTGASNGSLSHRSSKIKDIQNKENALPKTLKVRPESQPEDEDPIVESSLGDWVFDFPK